jgi:hypothetical protein
MKPPILSVLPIMHLPGLQLVSDPSRANYTFPILQEAQYITNHRSKVRAVLPGIL